MPEKLWELRLPGSWRHMWAESALPLPGAWRHMWAESAHPQGKLIYRIVIINVLVEGIFIQIFLSASCESQQIKVSNLGIYAL